MGEGEAHQRGPGCLKGYPVAGLDEVPVTIDALVRLHRHHPSLAPAAARGGYRASGTRRRTGPVRTWIAPFRSQVVPSAAIPCRPATSQTVVLSGRERTSESHAGGGEEPAAWAGGAGREQAAAASQQQEHSHFSSSTGGGPRRRAPAGTPGSAATRATMGASRPCLSSSRTWTSFGAVTAGAGTRRTQRRESGGRHRAAR